MIVRLRDGEQVRELAKGEASVDDRFRIGSVTKTFVAALTLDLADLGILSLDETVADFEPGLVSDAADITIRELLSHRAGLFDYTSDPALLRGELDPRALVGDRGREAAHDGLRVLEYELPRPRHRPAACGPRRRSIRCWSGRFSSRTASTTRPSSRTRSRARISTATSGPLRDGIATGSLTDTSDRTARSAWAAGAMVSTAADLDRFFTRLLAGDIGQRMRPRGDDRYGLGLARFETDCGPVVGHTGNLLGTLTVVWTRGDRVLVVAANVFPLTPEQEAAFQLLLERAFCG